ALLTWPIASVSAKRTSMSRRWRNSPGRSRGSSGTATRRVVVDASPVSDTGGDWLVEMRPLRVTDARAMTGSLGAVAAGCHVAPAAPTRSRRVVEHAAARFVRADLDSVRVVP